MASFFSYLTRFILNKEMKADSDNQNASAESSLHPQWQAGGNKNEK